MLSSRKEANVQRALEELAEFGSDRVAGVSCHVGKADDRKRLLSETLKRFGGRVDFLVSNAASNPFFGHTLDCSEDAWDKIFDTNLKAAFLLTKEIVPTMLKTGGGSIVFTSSIGAYTPLAVTINSYFLYTYKQMAFKPCMFKGLGPYSVSKTALLGLAKALSAELAPNGIRVNCVAPGVVPTKFASAVSHKGFMYTTFLPTCV